MLLKTKLYTCPKGGLLPFIKNIIMNNKPQYNSTNLFLDFFIVANKITPKNEKLNKYVKFRRKGEEKPLARRVELYSLNISDKFPRFLLIKYRVSMFVFLLNNSANP